MLVKYFLPDGAEAGVMEVSPSGMHAYALKNGRTQRYTKFYTTYSRIPVKDGQSLTLAQVVYPLKDTDDAEKIASQIVFDKVADGTAAVSYPSPIDGKKVTLKIDGNTAAFSH